MANKGTKYRIGRVRQLADGAWRADICEKGQSRAVRQFPTQAEARAFIDCEVVCRANNGLAPLTAAQILDAQEAISLLPDGMTLTQAARCAKSSTSHRSDHSKRRHRHIPLGETRRPASSRHHGGLQNVTSACSGENTEANSLPS